MNEAIRLENRGVIAVSGADATDFLQGILTNDIHLCRGPSAIYTGLLTPQGKLLFDFFVVGHEGGYLIDADSGETDNLLKRLMFYRLRADVELSERPDLALCVSLGESAPPPSSALISFRDPRHDHAGIRHILPGDEAANCLAAPQKWLAHRIALGLPEAGSDYAYGDCFPHDIAMDQLNGIGFQKGCYVGQEVVSRMQHRGTARKRPMIVNAATPLPDAPAKVTSGDRVMGALGSACGKSGLAEIRLDRAAKALEDGTGFDVNGTDVELLTPPWASYGEMFPRMKGRPEHD